MKLKSLLRFRLWHLMTVFTLIAIGLWVLTQHGIETAEIEITECHVVSAETNPGAKFLKLLAFDYLRPSDESHIGVFVFLRHQPWKKELEFGDRLTFRYRAKPIFGLKLTDPTEVALKNLGIDQENVQEIIIDSGDREN